MDKYILRIHVNHILVQWCRLIQQESIKDKTGK